MILVMYHPGINQFGLFYTKPQGEWKFIKHSTIEEFIDAGWEVLGEL